METYIIRDFNLIYSLTKNNHDNIILLHLDPNEKKAQYQSDFTKFELIKNLDYKIIKNIIDDYKKKNLI